jgi:hypothetical protein
MHLLSPQTSKEKRRKPLLAHEAIARAGPVAIPGKTQVKNLACRKQWSKVQEKPPKKKTCR